MRSITSERRLQKLVVVMSTNGVPASPQQTPSSYRCPACGETAPMLISWPWWICPNPSCQARFVPADSPPGAPAEGERASSPEKELRLDPGSPDKSVPQPNRPPSAAPPRPDQPSQPQKADAAAQSDKP